MKVQNITDIDGFFKVIDSCKGKVELVTGEGDRLNLKSKLSQYVSMANIFSNGEIPELEVIAYENRVRSCRRNIDTGCLTAVFRQQQDRISRAVSEKGAALFI